MKKIVTLLILYVLLTVLAVIFIGPFVYSLNYALLPPEFMGRLSSPLEYRLDNFIFLFGRYPVVQWFTNSIVVTVIVLIGNILIDSMAGYALSRFKFPGREGVYLVVLATMMVPFHLLLTPIYLDISGLKWHDTNLSVTVPFLFNAFFVFMSRQFFLAIPVDVEEAARIDGLGRARTFFRIVFPISGSLIISMIIFNVTWTWNSFLAPSTFLNKTDKFTLVVGLNSIKDARFEQTHLILAGVIVLSLPLILVFLFLQKYFVQGIATSGIKG